MESEPDQLYTLAQLLFIPLQAMPTSGIAFAVLLVMILLLCSALISSSEVAFFSLTANDFKDLEEESSPSAQRILYLKNQPRTLLATILISNNFINIAIVILSDFVLRNVLPLKTCDGWADSMIQALGFPFLSTSWLGSTIHFIITIIGVTFLLVLFGEVAPKVYARYNNLQLASFMSRSLMLLTRIFRPLSSVLVKGTNIIEKRLARSSNGKVTSREDIDQAIELTVKDDKHAERDMDILKGIVKFGDVPATRVMRSRVDVVAVDFRIGFKELLKVVRESGYSRIPVYDEDFDHLTGILYIKDLLGHLEEEENFEWQALINTNVLYVPEAKKINDLFREFQSQRQHMAVVVDEYGGSSGIVTLEDIMEEVIGDIKDESDDASEIEYIKVDDYNYIFEGKTLLNDVCRVIGVDTTTFDEVRGDADSVAGLLLELAGLIPKIETELSYNDFVFKIVAVNKRRIEQIQISLPQK
ncbi:MAG: gliding motility-associated protein GldE [Bacteroidota bacterium]